MSEGLGWSTSFDLAWDDPGASFVTVVDVRPTGAYYRSTASSDTQVLISRDRLQAAAERVQPVLDALKPYFRDVPIVLYEVDGEPVLEIGPKSRPLTFMFDAGRVVVAYRSAGFGAREPSKMLTLDEHPSQADLIQVFNNYAGCSQWVLNSLRLSGPRASWAGGYSGRKTGATFVSPEARALTGF
jgi:hypothetical protein